MRVGREQMDQTLVKHAICPILRIPSESASDRTSRNLHPHTLGGKLANNGILLVYPRQTLGVREYRHVPGDQDIEEEALHALRHSVVWRLDQHVTAIRQTQDVAVAKPLHEIRTNVGVGAANQLQR